MNLWQYMKIRKLKKWENYLEFVKSMNQDDFKALSVGSEEDLLDASEEKLFAEISIYAELREKYILNDIAGSSDFEKAVNIMQWLTDKTYYSGASAKWNADNPLDILSYSFEQGFDKAICCREKAIVLSDCLIAVGLRVYPLCMLSAKKAGCHFTVQAYISEMNKWIMLDPSFNCWFENDGTVLNAAELRQLFLDGGEPKIVNYSFNGTDFCKDIYLNGFVKQNLTNLSTWQDNSMDRRGYKKNDWNSKKEFNTKIPK